MSYADKNWVKELIAKVLKKCREDYIVESGSNKNGYYRKWNSGLIEQWGRITKGSDLSASKNWTDTYSLPISFSDTNYIVILTASTTTNIQAGAEFMVIPVSTSQMKVKMYNRNSSTAIENPVIIWSAKGF